MEDKEDGVSESDEVQFSDEIRLFLDRRYVYVVFALVVLIGSGAYVAYTAHATTETVTEERVMETWTTSTEFDHSATVMRDSAVFEAGDVLEGRALYFTSVSPVLDGTYTVRHGGDSPEPAAANAELTLVLRSVGDEGVEYWRESETLATASEASLEPGEPMRAEFSVNVTDAVHRVEEIEADLGASPGETQVLVTAETSMETTLEGEEFTDERSESLRIVPDTGTYAVSEDVDGQRSQDRTETFETVVEPSPLTAYGSVVLLILSSVLLVGVVVGRFRGTFELPPETVERMKFESQRDSLDEWISRGSLTGDGAETVMRLNTLEGLVDVAIDSNRRVTELDDGRYVVLVDGVRYVYEPSFEPEKDDGTGAEDGRESEDGGGTETDESAEEEVNERIGR